MIEADTLSDATAVQEPLKGETPCDWYRTAYTKRLDSALGALGFEDGHDSDSFKQLVGGRIRALAEEGFDAGKGDIKRAAFLKVVDWGVEQKGGGPAWEMMRRFAQSAYDDLSKLEASGVAPGPIPKVSSER